MDAQIRQFYFADRYDIITLRLQKYKFLCKKKPPIN